jgi:Core-2/I-Branching enzyme
VRTAFIVLAHRDPDQVARLITALQHRDARVYLHLDRRADRRPFDSALTQRNTEVQALERRRTRWGGIELVDASLDGLSRAVADRCEYFVLLSGQDFPLRRVNDLVAEFEAAPDRSYLTHWTFPVPFWRFGGRDRTDFYTYTVFGRRETCFPRGEDISFLNWKGRALNELLRLRGALKPRRRFPPYLEARAGWQWWNLSRSAAEHVLRFTGEHPDYRDYHRHTWCPDELFFQSVLVGTRYCEDHEVVNDSLRFTNWPTGEDHPRILRSSDLDAMRASGKPFARKFDSSVDDEVLVRLGELVSS